jgi:hypothetical protein
MQMKKILGILLAVCFLMSVTAAAVSACPDGHKDCKEKHEEHHKGHWEHKQVHHHHHKDKFHNQDWDEIVIIKIFVYN